MLSSNIFVFLSFIKSKEQLCHMICMFPRSHKTFGLYLLITMKHYHETHNKRVENIISENQWNLMPCSCPGYVRIIVSLFCLFQMGVFLRKVVDRIDGRCDDGKTAHDITDFRFYRPAVIHPNFTPHFYCGIGQSSKL